MLDKSKMVMAGFGKYEQPINETNNVPQAPPQQDYLDIHHRDSQLTWT